MPEPPRESALDRQIAAFLARPTPAAAEALAAVGDERALPALVAVAGDAMEGDEALRYRDAVRTLATRERLARWLAADDVDERRVAAHCLSARISEHVPLIATALRDDDAQVRAIGRRALRSWRASPALHDLFVDLLGHADPRVRLAAALGLEKIGKARDAAALRAAAARESDAQAQAKIAAALRAVAARG